MHAGLMRDRVTLQAATTVADSAGGRAVTWADSIERIPAQLVSQPAREVFEGTAVRFAKQAVVTVRYRSTITPGQRLRDETTDDVFEVLSVRDPDGRQRWLVLDVVEVNA